MSHMFLHTRKRFLLVRVILIGMILWTRAVAPQSKPGCSSKCGSLTIPYPFGVRGEPAGCYLDDLAGSFIIDCDTASDPPIPYWYKISNGIPVLNISLQEHEMRVKMVMTRDCYDASGEKTGHGFGSTQITLGNFQISTTQNRFTVVGCDSYAYFTGQTGSRFSTGCMSLCNSLADVTDGSCMGVGCCQTSFPENMKAYNISLSSYYNHTDVFGFNPCSFAFVVENDYFNFSTHYLKNITEEKMPMVVDWAVGSQTCSVAQQDPSTYMCKGNTNCTDAYNGSAYRCHCLRGYRGNSYLSGPEGCQDIDECIESNPCNMTCTNLPGSFNCSCPNGYEGDGLRNGTGCIKVRKKSTSASARDILLGGSIGFLVLCLLVSWFYWGLKQRAIAKEREQFFRQNGGITLQNLLAQHDNSVDIVKVFTDEELRKATDNYSETRILGQGGQGMVYKGIMPNNRVIAVKKAKMLDRSQVDDFINEVIVLSQINHKNVVKLIGCCLETEYPMLVYEFIPNGTLFDHIHSDPAHGYTISWDSRLRIAAETAGALSYLHSDTSIQIIHRDVKSTNILLDDNYIAKVSDFGASRLMLLDKTQLSTLVQGTLGYLDPEYLHTSQLTEKSDVYSFGVVLAELLTGKKALSFDKPERERNLSMLFTYAIKEDRLFEVVDRGILNEGNVEHIREVSMLAQRCLKVKGEERPRMKEVAMELEGLVRATMRHPWVKEDRKTEEALCLLGEPGDLYSCTPSISTVGYDSIRQQVPFDIEGGR